MAITLSGDGIARANLAADVIDGTKIADDSIESEHYAATSIDNEHLADDAVGVAELSATGTASSSTFLRGDNSWQSAADATKLPLAGGTLTGNLDVTMTSVGDGIDLIDTHTAHGITDYLPTDASLRLTENNATEGGGRIIGATDNTGQHALTFYGLCPDSPTATVQNFRFVAEKRDGGGTGTNAVAASKQIFSIWNGGDDRITVLGNGYMGINYAAPTNSLSIAATSPIRMNYTEGGGTAEHWYMKNDAGAGTFKILNVNSLNGAYLTHNSSSGWTNVSDRRWKTDWTPITGSLTKLNNIEVAKYHPMCPVETDFTDDESEESRFDVNNIVKAEPKEGDTENWFVGVSAQDCLTAGLEDVVNNPSDGAGGVDETKQKGVNYNELTAVCVQAIQELSAENEALKARITALENP